MTRTMLHEARRHSRRTVLGAAAMLFLSMVAGAAAQAADAVKLAYIAPLSGRLESYGKLQQFVVQMALDEINAAGGINGEKLELIVEDSAFDPQQAVEKVRKVTSRDNVFAILGPYGSGEMDVVAPLAVRLEVPMVSTVFTKIGVPGKNRPWVFRIGPNDDQVIKYAVTEYRKLFKDAKTVALIGNASEPYVAATLKDRLPEAFKQHGFTLVDTVEVTSGQVDYAPSVSRMAQSKANLMFVQAVAGELAGISKEIHRQGLDKSATIAGLQGPWAGPWLQLNSEAMDGWYAVGFYNPASTRPEVKAFVEKVKSRDGGAKVFPSLAVETTAYDALHIYAEVMRKAGIKSSTPLSEARSKIKDGLAAIKGYKGVSGTLSLNKEGETDGLVYTVFQAKSGHWVAVP